MCILLIQTVGNTRDLRSPQMYFCVYPPSLISFTQPFLHNARPLEDIHDNCPSAFSPQKTSNGAVPIQDYVEYCSDVFWGPEVVICWVLWWPSWWGVAQALSQYSHSLKCKWLISFGFCTVSCGMTNHFALENVRHNKFNGWYTWFTKQTVILFRFL